RIRQEADEVAGMPCLEGDADFAISLEAPDARTVASARIDDDEGALLRIDLDARRRDDADQRIVEGSGGCASVDQKLDGILEYVRGGLGHVLAILITALAHDVPEQERALGGIGHVFGCR